MDTHILIFVMLLPLMTTLQPARAASSNEDLMLPPDFPDFDDSHKDDLTASASSSPVGQQLQPRLLENLLSNEFFLSKMQPLAEFVDFKLRSLSFIGSLMTRDNFYLLRRFLFYLTRVSNFISGFMPAKPEHPGMMESFFREETETPLEGRSTDGISDFDSDHNNSNAVHKRSADGQDGIDVETLGSHLEHLEKWREILDEK